MIRYLTSLTYTIDGASFSPKTKLRKKKHAQTSSNELASPNAINRNTTGATMNMRAFRRPNASHTKPLSTLPNGWPKNVKLAALQQQPRKTVNFFLSVTDETKNCSVNSLQELTQPWRFIGRNSNRFIWIQCGSNAQQRWNYQRWKSIKTAFIQNYEVFYYSNNNLRKKISCIRRAV